MSETQTTSPADTTEKAAPVAPAPAKAPARKPAAKAPAAKSAPAKTAPKATAAKAEKAPPAEPKITARDAKQFLARLAVQAMADAIEASNGDSAEYWKVLPKADAKAIISQLSHHFPCGRTEDGAKWWPANLPRPDRSDWRT